MDSLLQTEIKQQRPFSTVAEHVYLNLVRTTEALSRGEFALLKERDLSFAQYNVLRILRGASGEGLSCGEIGERMVKRDPDVTRLLDRLVARGLVTRDRHRDDRRVVISMITDEGRQLLQEIDVPLTELHTRQVAHMDPAELEQLIALLERLRSPS